MSKALTKARKFIEDVAKLVLLVTIYPLLSLLPRRNDVWVFGSESGSATDFGDNGKYLFLYCHQHTNITAVWISRNRELVKQLSERGYHAYPRISLGAFYYTLRSRVGVFTRSVLCSDILWLFLGGAKRIQLWHGIPLKSLDASKDDPQSIIDWISYCVNDWSVFITTSEGLASDLFVRAGVSREKLVSTGYPRNEALHRQVPDADILGGAYEEYVAIGNDADTMIVYMPTWRGQGDDPIEDVLDLCALDEMLEGINAHLLIKGHALAEGGPGDEAGATSGFEHITFIASHTDIYPILREADILITDYSSVYFDYLLTGGKVIFYTYDFEEYRSCRGFQVEFNSVTPGPVVYEFESLCYWIKEFSCGTDGYCDDRKWLRTKIHDWEDGGYSRRVVDWINNVIEA